MSNPQNVGSHSDDWLRISGKINRGEFEKFEDYLVLTK